MIQKSNKFVAEQLHHDGFLDTQNHVHTQKQRGAEEGSNN